MPVAQAAHLAYARTFGGDDDWSSLPEHRRYRWGCIAVELNANRQETPNDTARAFYAAYHYDAPDAPKWIDVPDVIYARWRKCASLLQRYEREDR